MGAAMNQRDMWNDDLGLSNAGTSSSSLDRVFAEHRWAMRCTPALENSLYLVEIALEWL